MAPHSRLLGLPRELRDQIYHFYLYDVEGYHFNFEAGKLRRSNGQPIDLSLMLTCGTIASEMHGLALMSNTVVFTPVDLESERLKAGRYRWQMESLQFAKGRLLDTLLYDHMRHHLSPDIQAKMLAKYPSSKGILPLPTSPWHLDIQCGLFWSLNDAPESRFRDFQDDIIDSLPASFFEDSEQIFQGNSRFEANAEYECPLKMVSGFFSSSLRFLKPQVWHIPSEEEIAEMDKIFPLNGGISESNKHTTKNFVG